MITTTLNAIQSFSPCASGWKNLLKSLGKTGPDDEPLALVRILEINGLDDAIWCLRTIEGHDREIRLFAMACVRRVEPLNPICKPTLDVAERFANGEAIEEELKMAKEAARAAWLGAGGSRATWAAWATIGAAEWAAWAAQKAEAEAEEGAEVEKEVEAWEEERKHQQELFRKYFGEEEAE